MKSTITTQRPAGAITRRGLLSVLGVSAVVAATPALAAPSAAALTMQDHLDAIAALLDHAAGHCDGWRLTILHDPSDADELQVTAERFVRADEMVARRLLPRQRTEPVGLEVRNG